MIYGLWAKTNPYKSLMHHMIDAGNMSKYLLEKSNMSPILAKLRELIPEDNVIDLVSFLIALHDIGKCHPYFQGLYPSDFIIKLNRDGKLSIRQHYDYRHEIGSKIIIEQILKEKKYPPKLIRAVGSALRLHHQKGFQDLRNCRVPENMDKQFWETQHRAIFAKLEEIFTPRIELLQECKNIDAFSVLLWGLTVLSDWLCSGQDEFYSIDNSLS